MPFSDIEALLARVERPARYINSEYGAVSAKPDATLRMGLCYPAAYELGQSNQALQILYAAANALDDVAAQRVFLPGWDMSKLLRSEGIALCTLESATPLRDLDLLGITLPYELSFPTVLEILDLGGISLHAAERTDEEPIVIGGGPAAFNPEPVADFFDAFFIGEGEGALTEIIETIKRVGDDSGGGNLCRPPRTQTLAELAKIPGIYVPSLPQQKVTRQIFDDFADTQSPVAQSIVPYTELIHDRLALELRRGCTRGCRFCQAGTIYRPVRERKPDAIVRAAVAGVEQTGFDEVSLTSLSTADYGRIDELLRRLKLRFRDMGVAVSIPSLRVDSFSVDLARILSEGGKKSGLTFAPEAGTQRLRDVINKNVDEQQLLDTIVYAFAAGWRRVKLYFMIGLPTETDEDVIAIASLVKRCLTVAKEACQGAAAQLSVSVSTFVPKAHTPFQWAAQLPLAEVQRRQTLLRDAMPRKGVKLSWHDAEASFVEGVLARGGRELAPVIEALWRTRPQSVYTDHFDFGLWQQAFETCDIDAEERYARQREADEVLPWGFIDTGVRTEWLREEYDKALAGEVTPDCALGPCTDCGVCA